MSKTPITDLFRNEWPESNRHNLPCSFESAAFQHMEELEIQHWKLTQERDQWKACAMTLSDAATMAVGYIAAQCNGGSKSATFIRLNTSIEAFENLNTP
jgi:hypothetical protein